MTAGFLGLHFTKWSPGVSRRNIADPSTRLPLHPSRAPHANASRQRIRYGLSRRREGPAAGVRARLALRLSHLVRRAWPAHAKASPDRGVVAALFSRALGRRR